MESTRGTGLTRRTMLVGLGATGLAACGRESVPAAAQVRQRAAAQGEKLATGAMADWTRLVGSVFEGAGFRLRLAGLRPLISQGARPANVARASAFLLVFDTLGGADMPGGLIYALSTTGAGPLDVFLAKASSAEAPGRMHAVFN